MTQPTCRQGVRLLGDYVEGVLSRATRVALDRHVALCHLCRGFVKSYSATPGILRRATRSRIPADVRRALRARLEREYSNRRRQSPTP